MSLSEVLSLIGWLVADLLCLIVACGLFCFLFGIIAAPIIIVVTAIYCLVFPDGVTMTWTRFWWLVFLVGIGIVVGYLLMQEEDMVVQIFGGLAYIIVACVVYFKICELEGYERKDVESSEDSSSGGGWDEGYTPDPTEKKLEQIREELKQQNKLHEREVKALEAMKAEAEREELKKISENWLYPLDPWS